MARRKRLHKPDHPLIKYIESKLEPLNCYLFITGREKIYKIQALYGDITPELTETILDIHEKIEPLDFITDDFSYSLCMIVRIDI